MVSRIWEWPSGNEDKDNAWRTAGTRKGQEKKKSYVMKHSSPSRTGVQLPPVSKGHIFPLIPMQHPSKQQQICGWLNIKSSSFTYPARDLSKTTVGFNPTLALWQAVKGFRTQLQHAYNIVPPDPVLTEHLSRSEH